MGCQTTGVRTWENGNIPEENNYRPNFETMAFHIKSYNSRVSGSKFFSLPSAKPRELEYKVREETYIERQLEKTGLYSYLMYEDGYITVDEISPEHRFGNLVDNETLLYSMSVGKSLTGYLLGHAICQGYIDGVDENLSDWPLINDTLFEKQTLRNILNGRSGDSKHVTYSHFRASGLSAEANDIFTLVNLELAGTEIGPDVFNYGELPVRIVLNYISYKTGHNFNDFLNSVMQDYVGLKGKLIFTSSGGISESSGIINGQFAASRYDYIRIAETILEDWNSNNCLGSYLKDMYSSRQSKGMHSDNPFWNSSGYSAFFHTDYHRLRDETVIGGDGYGGVLLLINLDENRVVYTHAVHRDFNFNRIGYDAVGDGDI